MTRSRYLPNCACGAGLAGRCPRCAPRVELHPWDASWVVTINGEVASEPMSRHEAEQAKRRLEER